MHACPSSIDAACSLQVQMHAAHLSRAEKHLGGACSGFPDYGVHVNPAKTRVSFAMAAPGQRAPLPRNTYTGAPLQPALSPAHLPPTPPEPCAT
jgi:hypothetical protein